MAISKYNIKKWFKMLTGNSILHVKQGVGREYSCSEIKGYYNDLTEKVTKDNTTAEGELPQYPGNDGVYKIFPIGVFQYGLGAYDLYLETKEEKYLKKFKACVDWTIKNQDNNGGWKTFEYETPNTPYSAMAQGEAISLLTRAYSLYKDEQVLELIKKGIDFLMIPVEKGGVSLYDRNNVYLKEFVDRPVVLNGWIFAIFGIYDYLLIFPDDKKAKDFFESTINTLMRKLPEYDLQYWSKYDSEKRIASPFYHELHIAQLKVLYDLTKIDVFKVYSEKFDKYNNNMFYKMKAFIFKAIQKIKE